MNVIPPLLSMLVLVGLAVLPSSHAEEAGVVPSSRGRVVIEATPGEDLSEKLQAAFDQTRATGGGTVFLPPGNYVLTAPVCLAGRAERYPKGGVNGVTLEGNGATLTWKGPDEGAILDLPGAAFCTIRNLRLTGERGKGWKNVVGIRYRGGVERGVHGGKNNMFQQIEVQNVGIGFEVGGLYGPDLVGGTFLNCTTINLRIGYRFAGANVTSMVIINPLVAGYEEAGFQILGFTARKIRQNADEPVPPAEIPGAPSVLMDLENQNELFQKDLPAWLTAKDVSYPTFRRDEGATLWAGGGSLEITIYGLLGHSRFINSWMFDTNWGNVRVYSARIEGMGGILRQTAELPDSFPAGHYSTLFEDVNATSLGGTTGNVIEIRNRAPFYLIGGSYRANVALGNNVTLYTLGSRFQTSARPYASVLPQGYKEPLDGRFEKTGGTYVLGQLRGKGDLWRITPVEKPGIVQLPGTKGASIYELSQVTRLTLKVPKGATSVEAKLSELAPQVDAGYSLTATPGFDAGSLWYEGKRDDAVTIRFERAPSSDSTIDVTISRSPNRYLGRSS